jgi:hypothetical protein
MAQVASKRTAVLNDITPYIEAGIDPNTGLPIKCSETGIPKINLKSDIKRQLTVLDEQNAVNRFTWYNLPPELDGKLIERILYYRGQGALVKLPDDKYYFLPFALDGTIDVYGRYTGITPLPFNGTTTEEGKGKPLIKGLTYEPRYQVALPEDFIDEDGNISQGLAEHINRSAFILRDYTQQISQNIVSRHNLNDALLDVMADCIPFMRTHLLNSTGVLGMRISNEDEASNVIAANIALNRAALQGNKYVPIMGAVEFQELAGGDTAKAEEFMMAMQSLDNYRLSLYGLDNGGLFQKRSHMLEAEQEMNAGTAALAMFDSLSLRQEFCTIVNSYLGWGVWCEVSEPAIGVDRDGDGELSTDEESYNTAYDAEEGEIEDADNV